MSSPLIATAKATNANSYATVAEANQIARARLYTTVWDAATATPDADGYLVNGAVSAGSTTIDLDGGTGSFVAGDVVTFGSNSTEYTVSAWDGTTLTLSAALATTPADDEAVNRLTYSQKEKALAWATLLLDEMMIWYGVKRTTTQALWWPATGVVDLNGDYFDYDSIPTVLKVATFELALHLLGTNAFVKPSALGKGVSEVALGPLKAKIDAQQEVSTIPENILSLLSELGRLESEASKGSTIVPVRRV